MRVNRKTRFRVLVGFLTIIAFALLAGFLASSNRVEKAHAAGVRFFDANCGFVRSEHDDPLKFPGQDNAAHLHDFFGNTSIDENSTGANLLAHLGSNPPLDGSKTKCMPVGIVHTPPNSGNCGAYDVNGDCPAEREKDGAAYWAPAFYDCGTSDPGLYPLPSACVKILPKTLHIYYVTGTEPAGANCTPSTGTCVTAFPTGFGQIAGQRDKPGTACPASPPNGSANQLITSGCAREWQCLNNDNNNHYENVDGPFTCGPVGGQRKLRIAINFSLCWKGSSAGGGTNLFSLDQSHVAYPQGDSCPDSHPVLLPRLSFQEDFNLPDNASEGPQGHYYRLAVSSGETDPLGSTGTAHADFFNAWVPAKLQSLVSSCLNVAVSNTVPGCNVSP